MTTGASRKTFVNPAVKDLGRSVDPVGGAPANDPMEHGFKEPTPVLCRQPEFPALVTYPWVPSRREPTGDAAYGRSGLCSQRAGARPRVARQPLRSGVEPYG